MWRYQLCFFQEKCLSTLPQFSYKDVFKVSSSRRFFSSTSLSYTAARVHGHQHPWVFGSWWVCNTYPTPSLGVTSCCLPSTLCFPSYDTVTIHCKVSFLFESHLIVCKGRIVSVSFTLLSQLYIWLMDGAHEIFVEGMDGWISKSVIVSFDARHSCLFPETYFMQGLPIPWMFNENLGFALSPCSYEVLGKHFVPKFLYLLKMVIH